MTSTNAAAATPTDSEREQAGQLYETVLDATTSTARGRSASPARVTELCAMAPYADSPHTITGGYCGHPMCQPESCPNCQTIPSPHTITDRSGEPDAVFEAMLARVEATPEHWTCECSTQCADAACPSNPAIQRWIRGAR